MRTMTKELLHSLLLLVAVMMISTTFTACGDDDDSDESTGSNSVITDYGLVTETGIKTKSLFASAHDGDNVLTIPGFAPIRAEGNYNIYKHIVVSMRLYSDDEGNEFAKWTPGESIPSSFEKISGYGYYMNGLVRTKVKNSNEYVYAYIERVRDLEESTGGMDGNVIGVIIKYKSPINPETFKGFD